MGYFAQHINNIKRKTTIQPERLESGPIYEIRYRSDTASKTRYLVLAVNVYPYDAIWSPEPTETDLSLE